MSEADKIIESLKNSGRKVEEFYVSNKTSNKNVANIEDDVKIVKEFIDYAQGVIDDMEYERPVDVTVYQKDLTSMQNILAEREQMIAEKKKYTIRLTDEQYRKVIENAQMDTSNDTVVAHRFAVMQQQINEKDKQIQELEEESEILEFQNKQVENYAEELKRYNKTVSDRIVEYKKNSIPKQVVIDKIKEYDKRMEEDAGHPNWVITDRIVMNVLQELLEGER